MNVVKGYLHTIADGMDKLGKGMGVQMEGEYPSIVQFVLSCGREFEYRPRPEGVSKGEPHNCYQNAFNLATSNPHQYAYVEGWAAGIIPVEHAWCVTKEGIVVDPTWDEDIGYAGMALGKFAHAYFGVPFSNHFVLRTAITRQVYGVMDNYEEQWPLLRGEVKVKDWEHEWFASERSHQEDPGRD